MGVNGRFAELVAAGQFRYAHHFFDDKDAYLWAVGRGDRVRGEFVVIKVRTPLYWEEDMANWVAEMKGRVVLATAYELAAFAASKRPPRWDGQSKVLAFGSQLFRGAVPMVELDDEGDRVLSFETQHPSGMWRNDGSILCVKM
jgi:hypothetical protein